MHSLCLESCDSTQLLMGSPAPTTPPTCTMQPYQGWQLCGTTKYIPRMGCRMLHHWCICSRQCPEHNMVVMYVGECVKGHTHHYTTTLNHKHMQFWWWNPIPQNAIECLTFLHQHRQPLKDALMWSTQQQQTHTYSIANVRDRDRHTSLYYYTAAGV